MPVWQTKKRGNTPIACRHVFDNKRSQFVKNRTKARNTCFGRSPDLSPLRLPRGTKQPSRFPNGRTSPCSFWVFHSGGTVRDFHTIPYSPRNEAGHRNSVFTFFAPRMGLSAKSIDFLGNVHLLCRFSIKTFVLSCFHGGHYTSDIWLCQFFFHLWNNDMALADIRVVVRTGKLVDDYMALFATAGIKLVPTETVFSV